MRRLLLLAGLAGAGVAPAAVAAGPVNAGRIEALHARIQPLQTVILERKTRVEVTESSRRRSFAVPTDVLFAFDSARISGHGFAVLDTLAPRITTGPVTVVGHTDARGPAAYNDGLSLRRAAAVAAVLRASSAIRLVVRGAGEREPVASNARPGGRRRNRRVEIRVPSR